MRSITIIALAILLAPAAGCHSYLVPYDDRALPVRSTPTQGGDVLEVEDGEAYVRASPRDVGAALGVRLEDADEAAGVSVTACLREEKGLVPGDRIVHASVPFGDRKVREDPDWRRIHVAETPSAADVRATPQGHPVRSLADLRGYTAGLGWAHLDLVVLRGSTETAVCARLLDERRPLPVRRLQDEYARALGIEIASLADVPERYRPAGAEAEDQIVLRVDRDSSGARQGIRPLEVLKSSEAKLFQSTGVLTRERIRAMRSAGRGPRPTEIWIPFVFSYQRGGRRTHVGIGPLDAVFHSSQKAEYNADTDTFDETYRWSLFTTFCGEGTDTASGSKRRAYVSVIDGERVNYCIDWIEARDE